MTFFRWFWTFFSCFEIFFTCLKTIFSCFRTCRSFSLLSLIVASELSVGLAVVSVVIRLLHSKKPFTVCFCDKSFVKLKIYISNGIQTHNQFEIKSKLNRIIIEGINFQVFIFLNDNIDFIVAFPPKSCYQILSFRINSFSFNSYQSILSLATIYSLLFCVLFD